MFGLVSGKEVKSRKGGNDSDPYAICISIFCPTRILECHSAKIPRFSGWRLDTIEVKHGEKTYSYDPEY